MSVINRVVIPAVVVSLGASIALAEVQRVKCESTNDKYRYCSAKTDNEVRMIEQISEARCEEGKSWGHDKNGVWVDHNCGAEFEVGRSGPSTSAKVAAGATAGMAILQAMLAAKQPPAADAAATPVSTTGAALPAWLGGHSRPRTPRRMSSTTSRWTARG